MRTPTRLAFALISASLASTAVAGPQLFNGARSFAMGGTGAATALPGSASFHNPALLAMPQSDGHDGFALIFPSVSARVADDRNVTSQVDDIQNEIDRFNSAVSSNNTAAAQQSAQTLINQLTALNHDTMRGDLGTGLALAVPGRSLAFSVFADASLRATARANISSADINYLDQVANGSAAQIINKGNITSGYQFQSSGTVVAAAIAETGVSLARAFDHQGNTLTVGISPKLVQIRTFDYTRTVADFNQSDFHASQYETTDNKLNLDLGTAYRFGQAQQWTAGLSVKNLVPMKVSSVTGRELKIDPKVTAGIANSSGWHTVTLDVDLTPTKAFGFDDKTQWIALGAEANVLDTLQLRAGFRHNIANTGPDYGVHEDNELTAGFGLSPFGFNIEASGMISPSDRGAALELAFNF